MAPPLPALPELVGTLALSFTSAATAEAPEESPTVQRPDPAPSTPPPPATTTTTAEPAESGVPTPPTLPESTDDPSSGEAAPPQPETTAPPQPEPVATPAPATTEPPVEYDDVEVPEVPEAPAPKRVNLLAPTDKRFFFDLFVGGSRSLRGGYYSYFPGMDFKIEATIGGHGKKRDTLAGAAVVQLNYGGFLNSMTVGPRIQWDKPIVPSHALYMHTNLTLAYRATTYGYYGLLLGLPSALHSALFGVGWGVKAIVADRLSLNFRPVNFAISGPGFGIVSLEWDVMGGIGVVW